MNEHRAVYFREMQIAEHDPRPCEVCGQPGSDIHHIKARGMGGSKTANHIDNLMALCRPCHEHYGDKTSYRRFLRTVHGEFVETRTPYVLNHPYDQETFNIYKRKRQ